MKTWRTAVMLTRCGAEPGCTIHPGEPYLILCGDAQTWRLVRCERHACEPAPRGQIQADSRTDSVGNLTVPRFAPVKDLVADYKARAAGGD